MIGGIYRRILNQNLMRKGAIVVAGDVLNALFQFTIFSLLARALSLDTFGVFTTSVTLINAVALAMDLGLSSSIVRFTTEYAQKKQETRFVNVYQLAFFFRVLQFALLFIAAIFLGQYVSGKFLPKDGGHSLLVICCFGVFVVLMRNLLSQVLISRQLFTQNTLHNVFSGIVRMLLLGALFYAGRCEGVPIGAAEALFVFAVAPILVVLFYLLSARKKVTALRVDDETKSDLSDILHFSKWTLFSAVLVSIMNNQDVFFIKYYHDAATVAIYSAAYQLAFIFPIVLGALNSVLLPKVVSFERAEDIERFKRKWIKLFTSVCIPVLIAFILAGSFGIQLFFGEKYRLSSEYFPFMVVYFGISLLGNPVSLIYYKFNKPGFLTVMNLIHTVIRLLVGSFAIKHYGVYGALVTAILCNVIDVAFIFHFLKKMLPINSSTSVFQIYKA